MQSLPLITALKDWLRNLSYLEEGEWGGSWGRGEREGLKYGVWGIVHITKRTLHIQHKHTLHKQHIGAMNKDSIHTHTHAAYTNTHTYSEATCTHTQAHQEAPIKSSLGTLKDLLIWNKHSLIVMHLSGDGRENVSWLSWSWWRRSRRIGIRRRND